MNLVYVELWLISLSVFIYVDHADSDLPDLSNRGLLTQRSRNHSGMDPSGILDSISEIDDYVPISRGGKIIPSCKSFLVEFSKQAADFIKCSVDYARPFRFCVKCAAHYIKAIHVYDDIEKNDETLDDCRGLLLVSDRVQIINSVKESIKDVWTRADCKECFSVLSEDNNGTVTQDLTAEAKQFQIFYNNFTHCIPDNITMEQKNPAHNSTVCAECEHYYKELNKLFTKMLLKEDSPRPVCMDIVDMMNYTRLTWGKTLGCTVIHKDIIPVIIITCILLFVPVVFYVGLGVYGTKKQRKVLQEKRLSKFLSSNNYGSTQHSPFLSRSYDITASAGINHQFSNPVSDHGSLQHSGASTSREEPAGNRLNNRRLENSVS